MNDQTELPYGSRLEGNPQGVLADSTLSQEEKCNVLEDWLQDLLELQTATEESMLSDNKESGAVADQYQRVNNALKAVRDDASPEQGAAKAAR